MFICVGVFSMNIGSLELGEPYNMPTQSRKRGINMVLTQSQPYSTKRGRTMGTLTKTRKSFKLVSGSANVKLRLPYHNEMNIPTFQDGTVASYPMRGNSLYDPDYAWGGHQPMGYDAYSALFQKAFVSASTIEVDVAAYSVTATQGTDLCVWADAQAADPSGLDTIREACMAHGGT